MFHLLKRKVNKMSEEKFEDVNVEAPAEATDVAEVATETAAAPTEEAVESATVNPSAGKYEGDCGDKH